MINVRQKSMVSYFITPLSVALLLCGIFSIVWLRSNLISIEYRISELEKKRLDTLGETKTLMAEKSALLSLQKMEKTAMAGLGLVFPDRTKVVYIKERNSGPYKASFEAGHRSQDLDRSTIAKDSSGRGL